jgi:hypothetical protein
VPLPGISRRLFLFPTHDYTPSLRSFDPSRVLIIIMDVSPLLSVHSGSVVSVPTPPPPTASPAAPLPVPLPVPPTPSPPTRPTTTTVVAASSSNNTNNAKPNSGQKIGQIQPQASSRGPHVSSTPRPPISQLPVQPAPRLSPKEQMSKSLQTKPAPAPGTLHILFYILFYRHDAGGAGVVCIAHLPSITLTCPVN